MHHFTIGRAWVSLLRRWAAAALLLAALAGGCAQAPRQELATYHASLATVQIAATPLIDDLAIAERRNGQALIAAQARGGRSSCGAQWIAARGNFYVNKLCPEDAAYFASVGDPPGAAGLRRGLGTLLAQADALLALAENRNLDEANAQVQTLAGELAGLISVAAMPFGPTSGAAAAVGGLPAAAAALKPLLDELVKANNAKRVRDLILEYADRTEILIEALRNSIEPMFNVFAADVQVRANALPPMDPLQARAAVDQLEQYRRLLSDYSVLLERSAQAWALTAQAARSGPQVSLAALNATLASIRADAEAIRRAQAAFRQGRS